MDRVVSNEEFERAYSLPDNIRIIKSICNNYRNILNEDELRTCGQIALWRCLRHHDHNKGNKFTSSLYRFTQWECNREVRRVLSKRIAQEIDESVESQLSDDGPSLEMSEFLDQLSPVQKRVIYARFFERKTLREIGKEHNFTKEAARQHIQRAVNRLKKLCNLSYPVSIRA